MRLLIFPMQVKIRKNCNIPAILTDCFIYPKGPYPPQSAQREAPRDFVESSSPILSMYLEIATEEDKTMAENWKADADGILIFVRLF